MSLHSTVRRGTREPPLDTEVAGSSTREWMSGFSGHAFRKEVSSLLVAQAGVRRPRLLFRIVNGQPVSSKP